jgi:hypothetical protein
VSHDAAAPTSSLQEKQNSSSVKCFPGCRKSGTQRIALGEERLSGVPKSVRHSGKRGTRGSHLPGVQHSWKTGTRKRKFAFDGNIGRNRLPKQLKKVFSECHALALGEGDLFPECHAPALGEGASSPRAFSWHSGKGLFPSVTRKHSGKFFYFFSFFAPFFLCCLATLFKTLCSSLVQF